MKYIKNLNLSTKIMLTLLALEILFFSQFTIIFGIGDSMHPTLQDKNVFLCKRTKEAEVGDIIYYNVGGFHVAHRVIQVTEYQLGNKTIRAYTTKGDNNSDQDMLIIYRENIICKIVNKS